ncbi:MAG TPA: PEP-CTERM sorting domain-containing protein [Acidobacteriota bacterium]|nr:PEP-CTERM sorting domain-containing protein [Acidobacteriota bacterium]
MLIFLLVCATVCVLGVFIKQSAFVPIQSVSQVALEKSDASDLQQPIDTTKEERTVYPYSVIPGGIRSRAELLSRIVEDPVVAAHYASFEVDQTRFVKSEETQFVHVAYRLRNKIFWTAKTLAIPKGETLITDGRSLARTRCGNRVSVLPQEPISGEEPPVETFDIPVFETPMIASMSLPPLDLTQPPVPDLEIRPTDHLIPYVPIRPPSFENLRYRTLRPLALFPRVSTVPEPGTMSLMILGLVAFITVRFARKK